MTLTTAEMDVDDVKPVIPNMDANFVDDDDLQAALAKARRRKTTKVKVLSAEEIADRGTASFLSVISFESES